MKARTRCSASSWPGTCSAESTGRNLFGCNALHLQVFDSASFLAECAHDACQPGARGNFIHHRSGHLDGDRQDLWFGRNENEGRCLAGSCRGPAGGCGKDVDRLLIVASLQERRLRDRRPLGVFTSEVHPAAHARFVPYAAPGLELAIGVELLEFAVLFRVARIDLSDARLEDPREEGGRKGGGRLEVDGPFRADKSGEVVS